MNGTTRSQHPDEALLAECSQRIDAVLGQLLPAGSRVAFVNYPAITNVGDPALWLGTRAALRRCGIRVSHIAEPASYDPAAIRGLRRCDAILINGGGNFGDLWKGQQQVRERVLADFPETPTIQLAQSLWFEEEANLERMSHLLDRHRRFVGLWRDTASLERARQSLPGEHRPCPDMALALRPLPRHRTPDVDILWLARDDKESLHPPPAEPAEDVQVLDWLDPHVGPDPGFSARLAGRLHRRLVDRLNTGGGRPTRRLLRATYAPLARAQLRRGLGILSRGRVVITDRLHGHILALLMGLPHVVLDNSYGKVRGVFDRWSGAATCTRWAESATEAEVIARELLRDAIVSDPDGTG